MLGVTAGLALLLTAGCTPMREVASPPVTGLSPVEQPVWHLGVALVGEPVVRQGVVASYVRGGRTGLQVRAWSLADGHALWQHDALVGRAPSGVPLSLASVRRGSDEFVAFLAASADWSPSELAVVGLASGAFRRIRHPAVEATSRVGACGDDVCFEGWSLDTRHLRESSRPLRLDLATGRIGLDPATSPKDGFAIGDHLFAAPEGDEQRLVSTADRASWSRPYADVFGVGSSTGGGWDWRRIDGVLVGMGGTAPVLRDHVHRSDLADTAVVGLDPRSGATRWRLRGTAPCPGTALATAATGHVLELCRMRGTAEASAGGDLAAVVLHAVRMTRIGVDVRSGRVLWTRSAPDAATAIRPTTPTIDWTGRWHPIRERGHTLLIDRLTGATARMAPGAMLLCRTNRPLVHVDPQREADAGASLDPCSGALVSRGALERSAIGGGNGWWVVPGRTTLSAYLVEG